MNLEAIRKEWMELNSKLISLCKSKGGILTWDEYLAGGGSRIEELKTMWNRLCPEVIIYKGKP
jgi:hypothetical protein